MAKPLQTASVAAPGFYGLNTQESSITLAAGFALQADNCVIDKYGRLGARKGWQYLTEGNTGVNLTGAHEFIDINGTRYLGCWSGNNFYIANGSTLTPVTYVGSNTITTDGWQAVTLNDAAFLFSKDYEPIYFSPTTGVLDDVHAVPVNESFTITSAGTTATVNLVGHNLTVGTEIIVSGANETEYNGTFTIASVVDADNFTYTLSNSTTSPATGTIELKWVRFVPQANTALSAYGRVWCADTPTNKTTIYWSNLLDGQNFASGTAGSLDISSILVNGNDEIVALGAQAGRLIVFCKNNVIIFSDTDADKVLNPANMKLVEVINGVGCIARDSVQNTGTDILFLAKDGLRSLGRLIQEKSQPMRDLSKNVRDDLVRDVYGTDPTEIKSVYSASEAFYLLLLPEYKRIYCFDMRSMLQDGSARVTVWDNQTHTNMIEANDVLYFTNADGLARYYGYDDNGESYVIKYYTNYFDFGDSTKQKYLKRLSVTLVGGSGQDFVLKVGYDYDDSYRSFPTSISQQTNAEYGVAEYNTTAEYTIGTLSDTVRAPMGGSGGVLQVGFEATINGAQLSIQKLDIYIKEGRVY